MNDFLDFYTGLVWSEVVLDCGSQNHRMWTWKTTFYFAFKSNLNPSKYGFNRDSPLLAFQL